MSATAALAEFIRGHLERFTRSYEQLFSSGDVQSIHDFRVSCRRLSEPLGIISHWASGKKVRSAERDIKSLRRSLCRVRDYDVVLESLSGGPGSAHLTAEGLAQLEGILTTRRMRCFNKASGKVISAKPLKVLRVVEGLIRDFQNQVGGYDSDCVHHVVRETWRRRARGVLANAPTAPEPRNLHPLRVNFKKLRYCTELLYELEQRSADSFLGRCREMQDRLGAWNDHIFAARLCSRLATRESLLACQTGWCAAVLDYALSRARAAQAQREDLIRFWPTAEMAIQALIPPESGSIQMIRPVSHARDAHLPRMEEPAL